MTLRIKNDDRLPVGMLDGFPYRDIRQEEELRAAASRWPLLAAVDRQLQEARQRAFMRSHPGARPVEPDTVSDDPAPTHDDRHPVAGGSKPRRG